MSEKVKYFLIIAATIAVLYIVRFVPSPPPGNDEYAIPPDPEDIYGSY